MAQQEVQIAPNSTQQFVDVEEIKNGVVRLKGGGLRAVIMVAGINFELKSEEEQDIITNAYQDFLNSLDFPIQILIHSRKLSIDKYLKSVEERKEQEPSELLRNQIDEYIEFVRSFVKENEIMTKTFFVVVPYEGAGVEKVKKGIFSIFGSKKSGKEEEKETFEQQVIQLNQRVDQVLEGLERIGLRAVALNDDELVELYYNLYNPETTEKKIAKEDSQN
jgi:type IV secretory pathway VirB4 component